MAILITLLILLVLTSLIFLVLGLQDPKTFAVFLPMKWRLKKNVIKFAGGAFLIFSIELVIAFTQLGGNSTAPIQVSQSTPPITQNRSSESRSTSGQPSSSSSSSSYSNSTGRSCVIGDVCEIRTEDGGPMYIAATKELYDRMFDLIIAQDYEGLTYMQLAEQIYLIKHGTRVRVIDSAGFLGSTREVRLLDGEYAGYSGFVPYEFVK